MKKKKAQHKKSAGLYANIHTAQKRAAQGGRPVRNEGEAGAPTDEAFRRSVRTKKKKQKTSKSKG